MTIRARHRAGDALLAVYRSGELRGCGVGVPGVSAGTALSDAAPLTRLTEVTSSSAAPTTAADTGDFHFSCDLEYRDFIDGHLMALCVRENLLFLKGVGWHTTQETLDHIGEPLASVSYQFSGAQVRLARFPTGVAMLVLHGETLAGRLAVRSDDDLGAIEAIVRDRVPETPLSDGQESVIAFWRSDRGESAQASYRRVPVPSWDEIAGNYPAGVAQDLGGTMRDFVPGRGGRLLLWSGAPGTGKTYAIRALAWEWRKWCTVHYITDPEALFGGGAGYLMDLLLHRERRPANSSGALEPSLPTNARSPGRWRLLVLEDTGELMSADAKQRTGQGLSRLLNVVDGLIGQGFPALVLVTTNEELRDLHPAVARPGRCAAHTEFLPFTREEAARWLSAHGHDADAAEGQTLAELYGALDGQEALRLRHRRVGFGT